jgi:hypothetical protein
MQSVGAPPRTSSHVDGERSGPESAFGAGPHSSAPPSPAHAAGAARKPEWRQVARAAGRFLLLLAALWCVFEAIYLAFPYTRSGSVIIATAKLDAVRGKPLFPAGTARRVAVFGNSQVLSGMKPDVFDRIVGGGTASFNVGLPGENRFLFVLEEMLARGEIPTHILLTMPWQPRQVSPDAAAGSGDGEVMDMIFPFRHMPRDLVLFWLRAHSRGGVTAFYRQSRRSADEMLAARGYYFIEVQSHFPDNRLPDEFHLDSDQPTHVEARQGDAGAPEFRQLCRLLEDYHIDAYYVPLYRRVGERALPPPQNPQWLSVLAQSRRLHALGPDYWLMPNRSFADPVHVNPQGADEYTRRVAELMRPLLMSPQ